MSFTAPRRTQRRHRLAQAGTLGAALTLLLTACGGDPEPGETTTAPPSTPTSSGSSPASSPSEAAGETSPAPSPSTGAPTSADAGSASSGTYVPASADGPAQNVPKPEMPQVMKEETKEGAEAAVEYFWETTYFLQQTGNADPQKAVSGKTCKFCEQYKQSMTKLYESNGWMVGDSSSISSMLTQRSEEGYISTLLIDLSAETARDSNGDVLPNGDISPSTKTPWIAELSYSEQRGHWIVNDMTLESRTG